MTIVSRISQCARRGQQKFNKVAANAVTAFLKPPVLIAPTPEEIRMLKIKMKVQDFIFSLPDRIFAPIDKLVSKFVNKK